jgi:hypothetical protein
MDRKIEMADKKSRKFIARFAAATVAAGSILGGAALGLAAGAHASPTVQAQAQQARAMHATADPAARRQERPRVPIREPARPAAPSDAPQHHAPQRKSREM